MPSVFALLSALERGVSGNQGPPLIYACMMGIFTKKTEAEKQLQVACGSAVHALCQVMGGSMPPDFLDDVVDGCAESIVRLHRQVTQEVSEKAARKASIGHGRMIADVWATQRNAGSGSNLAQQRAQELIERILAS